MIGDIKAVLRRTALKLRNSGVEIGRGTQISASRLGHRTRVGADNLILQSEIGNHSYTGPRCVIVNARIGKYCSIATEVHVGTGSHPSKGFATVHPRFYLSRPSIGWDLVEKDGVEEFAPTTVGNDVWLGVRAVVRDGVHIGDGAIVGAGAVVVKDIEPYAIYAGVPAKLIRYRFPEEDIAFLLDLRWWDKSDDWLRDNVQLMSDVTALRRAHQKAESGR